MKELFFATGGQQVGCSIVEAFGKDAKPRELEEVLRLEYRSKLLNPKWAKVRHQGFRHIFLAPCLLHTCMSGANWTAEKWAPNYATMWLLMHF